MRKNVGGSSYEIGETSFGFECGVCGKQYEKPLQASLSSGSEVSEYFACPRCLSEVKSKAQEYRFAEQSSHETWLSEEEFKKLPLKTTELNLDARSETKWVCEHELGYLGSRPKNMPIPDQCLICKNMIECITH